MYRAISCLLLSACASLASAASVTIDTTVDSRDNLYYTSWGHWYTMPSDNALGNPYSNPAHAVLLNGVAFNFASYSSLTIAASGTVIDAGGTATDAAGAPCNVPSAACYFNDGNFRGQKAYSLIGIWSSSATSIIPLTSNWQSAIFEVGTGTTLNIPQIGSAYLFLAENDGYFQDNSGKYNVHIEATSAVPVPAAAPLMLSGLALLQLIRRKKV